MKLNRKTRYCCIAVIMAGIAVVGHAVVADRGVIAEHRGAASR